MDDLDKVLEEISRKRHGTPEVEEIKEEEEHLPDLQGKLRPYQADAVHAAIRSTCERPLIVMPTASGKSLVIAEIARILSLDGSVMVITHRKELVAQDTEEIEDATGETIGVWSAGLKRKSVGRVTVGSIQSMVRMPVERIPDDVCAVLIDEAHRVRKRGSFPKLFERIGQRNPDGFQIIGLTASPFHGDSRLSLIDAGVFDEIIYEAQIAPLIEEGYLSPLVAKVGCFHIDEANLERKTGGGDFTEKSQEAEIEQAIGKIAYDIAQQGADRKKWAVFLPSVAACDWMKDAMEELEVPSKIVVGTSGDRDETIAEYRKEDSDIRCLISCNVLVEGFNVRDIDLIALVRSTTSPVLYLQAVGRGTRIAEGKENCLVIDYGENVFRHGLIDDITLSKPKDTKGEAPVKVCQPGHEETGEGCGALVPAGCRVCPECGAEFPPPQKVVFVGDGREIAILKKNGLMGFPRAGLLKVRRVSIDPHISRAGNSMIKVTYHTEGIRRFEYLFPSKQKYGFKGQRWFSFIEQTCDDIDPSITGGLAVVDAVRVLRQEMKDVLYIWWQPQEGSTDYHTVLKRVCEGDPIPEEDQTI